MGENTNHLANRKRTDTMHTLTLQLPDEIFEPLMRQAQRSGNTPEAVVTDWVASAVLPPPEDPLLKLLGTVESDVSDVAEKHDEYLGQALAGGSHA